MPNAFFDEEKKNQKNCVTVNFEMSDEPRILYFFFFCLLLTTSLLIENTVFKYISMFFEREEKNIKITVFADNFNKVFAINTVCFFLWTATNLPAGCGYSFLLCVANFRESVYYRYFLMGLWHRNKTFFFRLQVSNATLNR